MARFPNWLVSLTRSAVGTIVFGFVLCGPASADLVTIDENCHGTITGEDGIPVALLCTLKDDPGPGGLSSVVTYTLPFAGVQGDVLLTDADFGGQFLDVIRFNGDGTVIFYSDNVEGFDALADTPSPPGTFYGNTFSIAELGPEGNNGASYVPSSGPPAQPGFAPAATYRFISDATVAAVAEPSPLALLLIGLGVMAFVLKRRGLGMG